MILNIKNEFNPLVSVVVCYGTNVPKWENYSNSDPEFIKYHNQSWNEKLLLTQQENFFKCLQKYKVNLIFPDTKSKLPHQMFTRDTAFVIGDKLYFSKNRKFKDRLGEIDCLLSVLNLKSEQLVEIDNEIEGGDILISGDNSVYIGTGSRTHKNAMNTLNEANVDTNILDLGNNVMHLDTRMTLLPNNYCLINPSAFLLSDYELLNKKYKLIQISDIESNDLASNVFVINPETIVVAKQHPQIISQLKKLKFNVEAIDYSQPINFRGSFRCTTLPLFRQD